MSHTIAAYSGGTLPAAIGIIRVSGADAFRLTDAVFAAKCGLPAAERSAGRMYYGELTAKDGRLLDLCLVCLYRAPASYTGEDMAEIFCHGSRPVVSEALEHLCAAGARPAEAGEFTRRAFLNGKTDLIRSEATADLIYAASPLAAKAAAAQLGGAVSGEIGAVSESLRAMLAHFYAVCDYTDEDIDPFEYERAAERLGAAAERLERLHAAFERGRVVRDGLPVVLLGRPNGGKSTLFNALVGQERAIVTEEAGTTRDVIEAVISCGGAAIRLMDTAGLREPEGQAEAMGIGLTVRAAESSAAAICVWDAAEPESDDDLRAARLAGERESWAIVINKSDRATERQLAETAQRARRLAPAVFALSARTGQGLEALADWLAELPPRPDELLITSARQAALLRQAAESLRLAQSSAEAGMTADAFLSDAERALSLLRQATGEEADADIAAEIFSRFCVGK